MRLAHIKITSVGLTRKKRLDSQCNLTANEMAAMQATCSAHKGRGGGGRGPQLNVPPSILVTTFRVSHEESTLLCVCCQYVSVRTVTHTVIKDTSIIYRLYLHIYIKVDNRGFLKSSPDESLSSVVASHRKSSLSSHHVPQQ